MSNKRDKSRHLPDHLKIQIGKFVQDEKKAGRKVVLTHVKAHFGVSYEQVRNAIRQYNAGELKTATKREKVDRKALQEAEQLLPDQIIEMQLALCLRELHSKKKLPTADRIALLDKLTDIRRQWQQIGLQSRIKRIDEEVILAILRKFLPNVTKDEAAAIYEEALENIKFPKSKKKGQ